MNKSELFKLRADVRLLQAFDQVVRDHVGDEEYFMLQDRAKQRNFERALQDKD
jgi:hypothetical protein